MLTFNVPCFSESCIEIKIKLNFYFHTSGASKGFMKALKAFFSLSPGSGWEGLRIIFDYRLFSNRHYCNKDFVYRVRFYFGEKDLMNHLFNSNIWPA